MFRLFEESETLKNIIPLRIQMRFLLLLYSSKGTKRYSTKAQYPQVSHSGTRSMRKNTASVAFNYQLDPLQRAFERKQSRFRRGSRRMKNIETRDHLIFDLGEALRTRRAFCSIFLSRHEGLLRTWTRHKRYDVSTIGNYCWLTTGCPVISSKRRSKKRLDCWIHRFRPEPHRFVKRKP